MSLWSFSFRNIDSRIMKKWYIMPLRIILSCWLEFIVAWFPVLEYRLDFGAFSCIVFVRPSTSHKSVVAFGSSYCIVHFSVIPFVYCLYILVKCIRVFYRLENSQGGQCKHKDQ